MATLRVFLGCLVIVSTIWDVPLEATKKQTLPPKASSTSKFTPEIPVRTGLHPKFIRYTFRWPKAVPVEIIKEVRQITIKFSGQGKLIYPKSIHKVNYVLGIESFQTPNLSLILKTKTDTTFRTSWLGNIFSIDVQQPLVSDFDKVDDRAVPKTKGADTPLKRLTNMQPKPPPLSALDALGPSASIAKVAEGPQSQDLSPGISTLKTTETEGTPPPTSDDPNSLSSYLNRLSQEKAGGAHQNIKIRLGAYGRFPSLIIQSEKPIPAGALVRSGRSFIVLKTDQSIDFPKFIDPWTDYFKGFTIEQAEGGQILRFIAPNDVYVHLIPANNRWIVTFERHRAFEVHPVDLTWVKSGNTYGLRALAADLSPMIQFKDPESGYMMQVFPTTKNNINISNRWTCSSLEMVPTIYGISFLIKDPDIRIQIMKEGLSIAHKNKLMVSSLAMTQLDRSPYYAASPIVFREKPRAYDPQFEEDIRQKINFVVGEARAKLYQDLALYYLDRGYFHEALTNLKLGMDLSEIMGQDATLQSMNGIIQILVNPSSVKLKSIFGHQSNFVEDVHLWRGVLAYYRDDNRNAMRLFTESMHLIHRYPPVLRNIILLCAAEVALELENSPSTFLRHLAHQFMTAEQRLHLEFLEGWRLEVERKPDAAIKVYQSLVNAENTKYSVYAGYRLAKLQFKENKITREDLIKRLEDLRYRWFGDKIQLKVIKLLGTTYIEHNKHAQGLRLLLYVMKNLSYISNMRNFYRLTSEAVYTGTMFMKDQPPLQRLSFFNEFRALIPDDERRDEIFHHLIDTLVEADLLPNAVAMLSSETQSPTVDKREQKLLRLSELYLMNNNYQQALIELDRVLLDQLNEIELKQHFMMRARALIMKRDFTGLNQWFMRYVDDTSTYNVRADAAWLQNQWDVALKHYRIFLQSLENPEHADEKLIMRAAVSALNIKDASTQMWLKNVYTERMKNSPYVRAFEKITDISTSPDNIGQQMIIGHSKGEGSQLTKVYESVLAEISDINTK